MIEGILKVKNHAVWFVAGEVAADLPVRRIYWWRLALDPQHVKSGASATYDLGTINWYSARPGQAWSTVKHDGSKPADVVEERAVEPPHTELQTRWHRGQWEIQLRSGKWVRAQFAREARP